MKKERKHNKMIPVETNPAKERYQQFFDSSFYIDTLRPSRRRSEIDIPTPR